jgi:hypothetical protein
MGKVMNLSFKLFFTLFIFLSFEASSETLFSVGTDKKKIGIPEAYVLNIDETLSSGMITYVKFGYFNKIKHIESQIILSEKEKCGVYCESTSPASFLKLEHKQTINNTTYLNWEVKESNNISNKSIKISVIYNDIISIVVIDDLKTYKKWKHHLKG